MICTHLARAERADLLAFLAGLSPQQWDTPTLCAGWRVRDVVAHMISYEGLRGRELCRRLARGGFRLAGTNAVGVAEMRDSGPDELLSLLEQRLEPSGLTTGFGGRVALLDAMIHQQDIRRPLGVPRTIPGERLVPALSFARFAPPIGAFWRARGLRLVATDLDWSDGRGPEVHGPGESLLMAIAGRRGVVEELTGPGQATLAARIGK
ncbi:maleylpyruvate isomerase family mycothiol-dependent enzyme [Pseudonocardia sp. DSM 110487]|uniref:maleylpyruvate isomerase family mycothiol-dependent enzyme n=1 Tax=Pseudonocardia sp. DSM 110487 TaxID=2865833 RepID=UPI001C69B235|nr:maleylpyruvate isomerase family mycothiol-dependent enzyme [Pseudonocardia sp. DSM 110487]QYN33368.1 maleylpyruvate isomerase family mycothiol-dependent enzyme [Pseudonocardia sp. DSM 110487]